MRKALELQQLALALHLRRTLMRAYPNAVEGAQDPGQRQGIGVNLG